jgi:hypothetical protein
MSDEPINLLVGLVTDSANDVLAGFQTWEDHIAYLKLIQKDYESKGIKLPLDLTEERITDDVQNHRNQSHLWEPVSRGSGSAKRTAAPIHDNRQGFLFEPGGD